MRQREATRNYDATGRLHDIKAPTLILHGKDDRLAPCALAQEMHARIQNSRMIVFNGGHHFLFVRPTQFVAAVDGFLNAQTAD
jgi:pimeloyl-ACP methyl ester carboxylesterase